MNCLVCKQNTSKYKCPACSTPYCSLACYKLHKEVCIPQSRESTTNPQDVKPASCTNAPEKFEKSNEKFEKILQNPEIQHYLSFDSLKVHLVTLLSILKDPDYTREQTAEARRDVALIKLRELRKGGSEANELVEMFVDKVTCLLDDDDDDEDS